MRNFLKYKNVYFVDSTEPSALLGHLLLDIGRGKYRLEVHPGRLNLQPVVHYILE